MTEFQGGTECQGDNVRRTECHDRVSGGQSVRGTTRHGDRVSGRGGVRKTALARQSVRRTECQDKASGQSVRIVSGQSVRKTKDHET